jgi:hypothetical protein
MDDPGEKYGYHLQRRKWKLQRLANEAGLVITFWHFPPRTSKQNKVEHGPFSFISSNWHSEPLCDY